EFIVTPETTYILIDGYHDYRRIFTDGRDWPTWIEPTYVGYLIGRWIDENGDGNYDVLEVQTAQSKRAASRDRASSTPVASPSTSTISPSSKNGFFSIRLTRKSFTTKSP